MKKLLILFPFLLGACVHEAHTPPTPSEEGGVQVTLNFSLPAGTVTEMTRALNAEQENAVDTLTVLVFEGQAGADIGTYMVKAAQTRTFSAQQVAEGKFTRTISLKPTSQDARTRLLVVANFQIGMPFNNQTYDEIVENTADDIMEKWTEERIPMTGLSDELQLTDGGQQIDIALIRMLARVDVGMGKRTGTIDESVWDGKDVGGATIPFVMEEVITPGTHEFAQLIPSPKNLTDGKVTAPSVPEYGMNFGMDVKHYFTHTGEFYTKPYSTRQIYIPEAALEKGTIGDADHEKRLALVVGGYYAGSTTKTWYRIDFAKDGLLVNVIRNHIYSFSITSVTGPGWATPEEAYASRTQNMNVEVVDFEQTPDSEVVFSGTGTFSVDKKSVTFGAWDTQTSYVPDSYVDNTQTITIRTDIMAGVRLFDGTGWREIGAYIDETWETAYFHYRICSVRVRPNVNEHYLKIYPRTTNIDYSVVPVPRIERLVFQLPGGQTLPIVATQQGASYSTARILITQYNEVTNKSEAHMYESSDTDVIPLLSGGGGGVKFTILVPSEIYSVMSGGESEMLRPNASYYNMQDYITYGIQPSHQDQVWYTGYFSYSPNDTGIARRCYLHLPDWGARFNFYQPPLVQTVTGVYDGGTLTRSNFANRLLENRTLYIESNEPINKDSVRFANTVNYSQSTGRLSLSNLVLLGEKINGEGQTIKQYSLTLSMDRRPVDSLGMVPLSVGRYVAILGRRSTLLFEEELSSYTPPANLIHASPGVIGVDAVTGRLTLAGSRIYRNTIVANSGTTATVEFGQMSPNDVYAVYYKYGSTIGVVPFHNPWTVGNIVHMPYAFDTNVSSFSYIPSGGATVSGADTYGIATNPKTGLGDPCTRFPGYQTPTSSWYDKFGKSGGMVSYGSEASNYATLDTTIRISASGTVGGTFSADKTVFLPFAGFTSSGIAIGAAGDQGYYRTASHLSGNQAYVMRPSRTGIAKPSDHTTNSFTVRCVKR